jgi:uncharacterized membrane protein YGL010W
MNKLACGFYIIEVKGGIQNEGTTILAPLYVFMIVVILLEAMIIFRLKTLSISKTQNTSILISLYFIFLVVMCGLQSW